VKHEGFAGLALLLSASLAIGVGACGATDTHATAPSTTNAAAATPPHAAAPLYQFKEKDIDGKPVALDHYAGKVLLVVNLASHCGFTPQYEGLEALYKKHQAEGLEVLAFPCDQFGNQEPGSENEIKTFCTTRYSVTFPLFSKIEVNGPNADPLYTYLRTEQKGSFTKDTPGAEKLYAHLEKSKPEVLGTDAIKWNFTKFLVDRSGHVVHRFESVETPESIEGAVVEALHHQGA